VGSADESIMGFLNLIPANSTDKSTILLLLSLLVIVLKTMHYLLSVLALTPYRDDSHTTAVIFRAFIFSFRVKRPKKRSPYRIQISPVFRKELVD
jgi:hypothetical protein